MNLVVNFLIILFIYNFNATAGYGRDWWKYTTLYEIYIRSFKDSDGDGLGDIQGIKSKLDHFVDLGIETLYITPFFKSPMYDAGYDITNFTDVDPDYGTIEDLDELLDEMNKRGLKLLMDFVINHSSDQHPWFEKSIDRVEPYTDFYVWANPKGYNKNGTPMPPNNWLSVFGGSAWKWIPKRKQFYLHQFGEKQPDFNLRNSVLKAELKNCLKFWFDKSVAGARLDAAKHFIEDIKLRDEPLRDSSSQSMKTVLAYHDLNHIYTTNLWETYEFIHELRDFIDQTYSFVNEEKILIVESYSDMKHLMMYFGKKDYNIVHFPFNYDFVMWKTFPSPRIMDRDIKKWLRNIPKHGVANWQTDNHDSPRIGSRYSVEFMDVMIITMLTLPGVACIYYGQEIGMVNHKVRLDQVQDRTADVAVTLLTRDLERLPMQWDDSLNGGFTSKAVPWLPVNPDYWRVNVKAQKNQPNSRYNLFKILSKLRRTKTLKYGNFKSYLISAWVYAFSRSLPDEPSIITILNLGTETESFHLHHNIPNLPPFVKVLAASLNAGYKPG
ncbi:hypothetical protein V9T40_000122 [Parthenolecanium corni]|uniref:alpha-glucosidase n=1 Tax=Parthenolecanium corni TaxID=536013 RepID=A0AAN9TFX7_9HEMI